MDCKRSRRGRPKGSGIDDSRLLREIAEMINKDPELKPTTAIKNTGIYDPSTIRRLRDKFNRKKEILFRELNSQDRIEKQYNSLNTHGAPAHSQAAEARTMALNHQREPARSEPVAKKTSDGPREKSGSDSDDEPRRRGCYDNLQNDAMRRIFADSLRTASAFWQFQLLISAQTFQSPVMRSALRYQLAYSQTLFGFGGPQLATEPQPT